MTRDEAEKEMEELQTTLNQYKEALKERDRQLKEKDEQAEELRQEGQTSLSYFYISGLTSTTFSSSCLANSLRIELKAEIERAKTLAVNAHLRSSRKWPAPFSINADPKQAIITKFYEDLTNLLVPNMKPQNGKYLDIDDWLLSCVFTHRDVTDEDSMPKSESYPLLHSTPLINPRFENRFAI